MPLTPNQALPYQTGADQLGPEGLEAAVRAIEGQLVMQFASAADRASRLPIATEGMLCWLQDVNRFEGHDGTAWVEIPDIDKVRDLIWAWDSRPHGKAGAAFANTNIALTTAYQLLHKVTFTNPSASRVYCWYYNDLFYSSSAPRVADVISTVASGSSASAGGDLLTSWQVPIVIDTADGGSRLTLVGRGSGFPAGTVTLGVFAKMVTGAGIVSSGAKFLDIDDVGI